jgi:hypothetical protein
MALVLKDRVKETTTTQGTGTISLLGAVQGYQGFSSIGIGNTTYYCIQDTTDWEIGIGTVGSGSLTRDTVLASSNNGSLVGFGSGVKDVFCTYPADKSVSTDSLPVTGAISSASPNATVNVASLTSAVTTTNGDLALVKKGTGALLAQVPTGTTAGGNKRGQYAVDLVSFRLNAANVASGDYSFLGGGYDNKASNSYSAVVGGAGNFATGNNSFIGGGIDNQANNITSGVAAGRLNVASADYAMVGGGRENVASGGYSSAGGGRQNTASAAYSAVAGGYLNAASGTGSAIDGGQQNVASSAYSFVGGGLTNTASASAAVVAGGESNTASGGYSSVGGGISNTASGLWSGVGSGLNNIASGGIAYVASGGANTASGDYSFVAGGSDNVASGNVSAVIGGVYGTTRGIIGYLVTPASNTPIEAKAGVQQAARLVLGVQTTNATATKLRSNTSSADATNQLILQNNSAIYFKGTVIANVTAGGDTKSWTFDGQIKRGANAAATTLTGSTVSSPYGDAGASTWAVSLAADTTNGGLAVTVTGQASTTIRWVCKLETTEVGF